MVDVLILNYNDWKTTRELVFEIADYKVIRNILIVDNGSTDNSFEYLCQLQTERIIVVQTDKNGGYGYGNNYGIKYLVKHYNSEFILLCNPDIHIMNDAIVELESFLLNHSECVMCAPMMTDISNRVQYNTAFILPTKWQYLLSGGILLTKAFFPRYHEEILEWKDEYRFVDSVSGSLFLLRTKDFMLYGMYDEAIFLYGEEIVLGIKFKKAKLKIALLPRFNFIHEHSVSINKTYKSEVAKRKLIISSKLHILKRYYNANSAEMIIANLLCFLSIIELKIINALRIR